MPATISPYIIEQKAQQLLDQVAAPSISNPTPQRIVELYDQISNGKPVGTITAKELRILDETVYGLTKDFSAIYESDVSYEAANIIKDNPEFKKPSLEAFDQKTQSLTKQLSQVPAKEIPTPERITKLYREMSEGIDISKTATSAELTYVQETAAHLHNRIAGQASFDISSISSEAADVLANEPENVRAAYEEMRERRGGEGFQLRNEFGKMQAEWQQQDQLKAQQSQQTQAKTQSEQQEQQNQPPQQQRGPTEESLNLQESQTTQRERQAAEQARANQEAGGRVSSAVESQGDLLRAGVEARRVQLATQGTELYLHNQSLNNHLTDALLEPNPEAALRSMELAWADLGKLKELNCPPERLATYENEFRSFESPVLDKAKQSLVEHAQRLNSGNLSAAEAETSIAEINRANRLVAGLSGDEAIVARAAQYTAAAETRAAEIRANPPAQRPLEPVAEKITVAPVEPPIVQPVDNVPPQNTIKLQVAEPISPGDLKPSFSIREGIRPEAAFERGTSRGTITDYFKGNGFSGDLNFYPTTNSVIVHSTNPGFNEVHARLSRTAGQTTHEIQHQQQQQQQEPASQSDLQKLQRTQQQEQQRQQTEQRPVAENVAPLQEVKEATPHRLSARNGSVRIGFPPEATYAEIDKFMGDRGISPDKYETKLRQASDGSFIKSVKATAEMNADTFLKLGARNIPESGWAGLDEVQYRKADALRGQAAHDSARSIAGKEWEPVGEHGVQMAKVESAETANRLSHNLERAGIAKENIRIEPVTGSAEMMVRVNDPGLATIMETGKPMRKAGPVAANDPYAPIKEDFTPKHAQLVDGETKPPEGESTKHEPYTDRAKFLEKREFIRTQQAEQKQQALQQQQQSLQTPQKQPQQEAQFKQNDNLNVDQRLEQLNQRVKQQAMQTQQTAAVTSATPEHLIVTTATPETLAVRTPQINHAEPIHEPTQSKSGGAAMNLYSVGEGVKEFVTAGTLEQKAVAGVQVVSGATGMGAELAGLSETAGAIGAYTTTALGAYQTVKAAVTTKGDAIDKGAAAADAAGEFSWGAAANIATGGLARGAGSELWKSYKENGISNPAEWTGETLAKANAATLMGQYAKVDEELAEVRASATGTVDINHQDRNGHERLEAYGALKAESDELRAETLTNLRKSKPEMSKAERWTAADKNARDPAALIKFMEQKDQRINEEEKTDNSTKGIFEKASGWGSKVLAKDAPVNIYDYERIQLKAAKGDAVLYAAGVEHDRKDTTTAAPSAQKFDAATMARIQEQAMVLQASKASTNNIEIADGTRVAASSARGSQQQSQSATPE